jgi:hypothetical protein
MRCDRIRLGISGLTWSGWPDRRGRGSTAASRGRMSGTATEAVVAAYRIALSVSRADLSGDAGPARCVID